VSLPGLAQFDVGGGVAGSPGFATGGVVGAPPPPGPGCEGGFGVFGIDGVFGVIGVPGSGTAGAPDVSTSPVQAPSANSSARRAEAIDFLITCLGRF
jgi:hypothetical protein